MSSRCFILCGRVEVLSFRGSILLIMFCSIVNFLRESKGNALRNVISLISMKSISLQIRRSVRIIVVMLIQSVRINQTAVLGS